MKQEYRIIPEELSPEAFGPYGKAIVAPANPAAVRGPDWEAWIGLGRFEEGTPAVGMVVTRPTDGKIVAMEREPKVELVLPITGPIIQAVALPGDLEDHTQQPDAATVRAFIIHPGQAVLMSPGTWHWAALPFHQGALYYFITEPHPPEPGHEASSWVPFQLDDIVWVKFSGSSQ